MNKRAAILICFCIITLNCFAQDSTERFEPIVKQPEIFIEHEEPPHPPYDLTQYIAKHLSYPETLKKQQVEGKVILQFMVRKNGKIDSVKVIRHLHPVLDASAKKMVEGMPRWIPGKFMGKIVGFKYTMPVVFKLE